MKLNHIGIVVSNIKNKLKFYEKICGSSLSPPQIIIDKTQQVKVCFISAGKTTLELVEPLNETSPISNFLKHGGGINHLCFEIDDLEKTIQLTKDAGGLIVQESIASIAFGGRWIVFVFFKELGLIEFLEKKCSKQN